MLMKSGLFVFLLTALQVSALYKAVTTNNVENEIDRESPSVWEARPGQIPHYVALRIFNSNGRVERCGGAIASKEWVITAAQCFITLRSLTVRFGLSYDNPDFILDATEWYNHPSYNIHINRVQPNDIGLVKLQRPVVYTDLVKPIRVQPSADAYRNYDGELAYVSGLDRIWGIGHFPDKLIWVYVLAISNTECARIYPSGNVVATTICVRYFNVTIQSCWGDSGDPLVHVDADGVPTLIGLWSFLIPGNCGSGLPFAFTRPGPYLAWFKEVTGIDFENLQEDITTTTTSTPAPTTTTTELITTTTTEAEEQKPTPDGSTISPDDSGEEDDSESDQDDDIAQLLKRLQVSVKVKVRIDKFNTTKAVGMEVDQKH